MSDSHIVLGIVFVELFGQVASAVCMCLHGFVFGVIVVGDGVSGVACRVPVKSDDWEPKPFEFARVARGSADSMCLSGFCFWWLPVVGVCLGVCWWRAKFQ